jgi:hypothetical protein
MTTFFIPFFACFRSVQTGRDASLQKSRHDTLQTKNDNIFHSIFASLSLSTDGAGRVSAKAGLQ